MSNINDLFTTRSAQGYHDRISLTEIRPNPLNFYRKHDESEEARIQNMAEQNQGKWQKMDLIVYEEEKDDGCHYTLLSGEKRWRMAKYNYEHGTGSEMLDVTVYPKPESIDEEKMSIIGYNNHTQFNKKTKLEIVKTFWDIIEQNNPEWSVTKRSKVIASYLDEESDNYERTIRNYFRELNLIKGEKSSIEKNVDLAEEQQILEDEERKQILKENLERISQEISDQIAIKSTLKQTKKKGYALTLHAENFDDLFSLLSILDCENVNLNGLD